MLYSGNMVLNWKFSGPQSPHICRSCSTTSKESKLRKIHKSRSVRGQCLGKTCHSGGMLWSDELYAIDNARQKIRVSSGPGCDGAPKLA